MKLNDREFAAVEIGLLMFANLERDELIEEYPEFFLDSPENPTVILEPLEYEETEKLRARLREAYNVPSRRD
jgi:hypothetical protein